MTLPGVAVTYNGEEIGMVVCFIFKCLHKLDTYQKFFLSSRITKLLHGMKLWTLKHVMHPKVNSNGAQETQPALPTNGTQKQMQVRVISPLFNVHILTFGIHP
jgi:hypothetical protein